MTGAVIEAVNVGHLYGDIRALQQVSLEVPAHSFFALLGPNGAGKTTLVSILSTLLRADEGEARVAGFDVRRQSARVRRQLGLVFQEPSLDERLTLLENLEFHGRLYGMPGRQRRLRAAEVLALVELSEWENAPVRVLSRGMKRRLEIGRAVMHDPALLILDEPSTGLDVQSRHRIWAYLHALRAETGVSILLTTHQIEEAEGADLVAIVDHGQLLRLGTPEALRGEQGDSVIVLRGVRPELRARLERQYPVETQGDSLRLTVGDVQAALVALAPELPGVQGLSVQRPTLEDVFLRLTGRALREERAGAPDALLAFARQGGEHTR